jgi:hypothetical protein
MRSRRGITLIELLVVIAPLTNCWVANNLT